MIVISWTFTIVVGMGLYAIWIGTQRAAVINRQVDGVEQKVDQMTAKVDVAVEKRDMQHEKQNQQFDILRENTWMIMSAIGMKPPTTRPLP